MKKYLSIFFAVLAACQASTLHLTNHRATEVRLNIVFDGEAGELSVALNQDETRSFEVPELGMEITSYGVNVLNAVHFAAPIAPSEIQLTLNSGQFRDDLVRFRGSQSPDVIPASSTPVIGSIEMPAWRTRQAASFVMGSTGCGILFSERPCGGPAEWVTRYGDGN